MASNYCTCLANIQPSTCFNSEYATNVSFTLTIIRLEMYCCVMIMPEVGAESLQKLFSLTVFKAPWQPLTSLSNPNAYMQKSFFIPLACMCVLYLLDQTPLSISHCSRIAVASYRDDNNMVIWPACHKPTF